MKPSELKVLTEAVRWYKQMEREYGKQMFEHPFMPVREFRLAKAVLRLLNSK